MKKIKSSLDRKLLLSFIVKSVFFSAVFCALFSAVIAAFFISLISGLNLRSIFQQLLW